jgi:prepilin-type processing-associated H-X9-DG protein
MQKVNDQGLAQLAQAQKGLIDAGAPVIYLALSEFPPKGPVVYAPLAAKGNALAVRSIFYSGQVNGQKGPEVNPARPLDAVTVAMPEGVYYGRADTYLRIKEPHAGAPHLIFAVMTAPPGGIQIAMAPSETIVTAMENAMAQLPPPIDMPITTLTRGIASASGGLQTPPSPAANVVIHATDAAAATQLKTLFDRVLPMLNNPQLQKQMPGFDSTALIAALTPKVDNDTLTVSVDEAQLKGMFSKAMFASLLRAREQAKMVQSASQIKSIGQFILLYTNRHQGNLPDTLDQATNGRIPPNPRGTTPAADYVYVKPVAKVSALKPDMILVYENPADLRPGTAIINAGFGDGHVEAMPLATLQARLAAQPAAPATQGGR